MPVAVVRSPGPRLNLSFKEASQMLGVSRWTLGREIADGKIRVVKIRGVVRVPKVEVERYQRALYRAAIAAAPEIDEVDAEAAS